MTLSLIDCGNEHPSLFTFDQGNVSLSRSSGDLQVPFLSLYRLGRWSFPKSKPFSPLCFRPLANLCIMVIFSLRK